MSSNTNWLKDKLIKHSEVKEIIIDSEVLIIEKKKTGEKFRISVMSAECIRVSDVEEHITPTTDFLVNIKREPKVDGDALDLLLERKVLFGGVSDIQRALSIDEFKSYINPNLFYVERMLKQHSKVSALIRLDSKRYLLRRKRALAEVVVLNLNVNEVTAEIFKSLVDNYDDFKIVLCSDPKCRITKKARVVAEQLGISLFKLDELHSALNKKNVT